jgi:hypothetical protein
MEIRVVKSVYHRKTTFHPFDFLHFTIKNRIASDGWMILYFKKRPRWVYMVLKCNEQYYHFLLFRSRKIKTGAPIRAVMVPRGISEGWKAERAMVSQVVKKTAPRIALAGTETL